jgi:hypothetical protein
VTGSNPLALTAAHCWKVPEVSTDACSSRMPLKKIDRSAMAAARAEAADTSQAAYFASMWRSVCIFRVKFVPPGLSVPDISTR